MLDVIRDESELEELLSEPPEYVIKSLSKAPGDTIVLGAGGKMGPSLTRMLVRACKAAGDDRTITAVSRFSCDATRQTMEGLGVRTIAGDLLNEGFIPSLPDAANVIHMTGMKFGTGSNAAATWAMNTHLPSLVCQRYRSSKIMAFSTGNVYPLVDIAGPWSRETDALNPLGEYGMSALGRERIFEYFATQHGIPTSLARLNYAVEMRYGVLIDIAERVLRQECLDLTMGFANVIWQGDANAMAIASLGDATVPANVVNIAGPELVNVREVAERFGSLFGVAVKFSGSAASTALLNDGNRGHTQYAAPRVSLDQLIHWIANWRLRGGTTLGKPTHFEVRSGQF